VEVIYSVTTIMSTNYLGMYCYFPEKPRPIVQVGSSIYLRNGKRAACNHGVMDARGRLLSTKEA